MSVHFMSQSVHWATPKGTLDELDAEFNFTDDPCPLYGDLEGVDGLSREWGGVVFCNPPYGREIGKWTRKAVEQAAQGKTIVLLIPSRTDTKWWHEDVMTADEIRFIRGRLKFGTSTNSAPFPSALAIWKPKEKRND